MKQKILLVDGYNMIGAWAETRSLFKTNQLEAARDILLQKLSHYAHFEQVETICVFDAQFVPGTRQKYEQYHVTVIFTEEHETADSYIERLAGELETPLTIVEVATSDLNEQWTVFSQGALRLPARELEKRVSVVKKDLDQLVDQIDLATPRLTPWSEGHLQALKNLMEEVE